MDKTNSEQHLFSTLVQLKGNSKACLFTEPIWGIPYNLFAPFVTLYMYALGVKDAQIGVVLTISMLVQIPAALLGGILADKFGRRKTLFIVDLIAWTIPCLFWMFAQNFWWFLIAALFNSANWITSNAWQCMLVEDSDPRQLVNIFTWMNIAGLLAVFFAPVSALLVSRYTWSRRFGFSMVLRLYL